MHPFDKGRVVVALVAVGSMSGRKLPQGASIINRHSIAVKCAIKEVVLIGCAAGKMWEEVVVVHEDGCSECNF